jgi:hypothetical protein
MPGTLASRPPRHVFAPVVKRAPLPPPPRWEKGRVRPVLPRLEITPRSRRLMQVLIVLAIVATIVSYPALSPPVSRRLAAWLDVASDRLAASAFRALPTGRR